MTISSANNRLDYNGNGSTTVFPYNFKIQSSSQIEVILVSSAGVETTQTLTANYTLSGIGDASGGNVTMITAPASDESLVVRIKSDYLQETDYVSGDPFPAETHEAALDKLTINDKAQNEALARCVQAPDQDASIGKLPTVTNRKNKILTFDVNGDPETSVLTADISNLINNLLVGTEISGYSTVIETKLGSEADGSNKFTLSQTYTPGNNNLFVFRNGQLLRNGASFDYTETSSTEVTLTYDPNDGDSFLFVIGVLSAAGSIDSSNVTYTPAGSGAVATNVQAKLREMVSVTDFGAVNDAAGDGTSGTDNTAAIQAAIDHANTLITGGVEGVTVYLPDGNYLIKGTITTYPGIYLRGENTSVKMITAVSGTSLTDIGGGVYPVVYCASSIAFGEISNIKIYDYSVTCTDVVYFGNQIDGEAFRMFNFLLLGGSSSSISMEGCTYFNVSNFQGGQTGGYYFEIRSPQSDHVLNIDRANVDSCRNGFVKVGDGTTIGCLVNITNSRYEHNYSEYTAITSTSASGGDTQLTVTGHGFVSGDVNSQIRVTGTTHITPGFYTLVSITDANNVVIDVTYPGSSDTSGYAALAQDIVTINTSETVIDSRPHVSINSLHLSVSGAGISYNGFNSIVRMNENFICRGNIIGVVYGTAASQPNNVVYVQNDQSKTISWDDTKHLSNFFLLNDGLSGSPFLDIYEEGSWTPIIEGVSVAGAGTYSTQSGFYTRVGNVVTWWCELTWSAFTGTAGIRLKGFPYTPSGNLHAISVVLNNYTMTANHVPVGVMNNGTASAFIQQVPVGGGAIIELPIDTAASLYASGSYRVS